MLTDPLTSVPARVNSVGLVTSVTATVPVPLRVPLLDRSMVSAAPGTPEGSPVVWLIQFVPMSKTVEVVPVQVYVVIGRLPAAVWVRYVQATDERQAVVC